jgi:hypothetical protein
MAILIVVAALILAASVAPAVAENANGTDMQTWVWDVTAASTATETAALVEDIWKGSTHRLHFPKCSVGSTHRLQL